LEVYSFRLETLDEDAIQERDERLDGLESRLGSLKKVIKSCYSIRNQDYHWRRGMKLELK
jgi:hypothetical protein